MTIAPEIQGFFGFTGGRNSRRSYRSRKGGKSGGRKSRRSYRSR